jgi:hypothetical protein
VVVIFTAKVGIAHLLAYTVLGHAEEKSLKNYDNYFSPK